MLKGWIVILGADKNLSVTPSSVIKNLLKEGQETSIIPIFPNKEDAEYYSALFCKDNDKIKNVAIVEASSLLQKGLGRFDFLVKQGEVKPSFLDKIKKFFKFSD